MATTYLAQSLKDQGYTGATGTTPYKPVTEQQLNSLKELHDNSPAANVPRVVSAAATVININFDGTKNNGQFPAPGESPTNVFQLTKLQQESNGKDNTLYLPGIGSQALPSGTLDANGNPAPSSSPSNWDAIPTNAGKVGSDIVEKAYEQLTDRVKQILTENPNAEISLNVAGFSRGAAESYDFGNLLKERGIPGLCGPGECKIDTMTLFDPVDMTNGQLKTTPPDNVKNTLVLVAMDEGRAIMPAMPVGADAVVVGVPGEHADVGGSFNQQGIPAVTLKLARDFQEASGVPVADIPADLAPDWSQMNVHNSALDKFGNTKWDWSEGARYHEGAGLGSQTVQDIVQNGVRVEPTPANPAAADAADYQVPADPAQPDGEQLTVRESIDRSGRTTATVMNAAGEVLLSAGPGQMLMRDPDTGIVSVRTQGSNEVQQYDPATRSVSTDTETHQLRPDLTSEQAEQLSKDLGLNPGASTEPAIQIAAAGDGIQTDGGNITGYADNSASNQAAAGAQYAQAAINTEAGQSSFSTYLQGPGAGLSPAQQGALAAQLDGLHLGGEADLSFHPQPGGGVLISNRDGDIVGEIKHSDNGDINLRANSITLDGAASQTSTHITSNGQTLSDSQYTQAQLQSATQSAALLNTLVGLQHWASLGDVQRLSALTALYNVADNLNKGTLPGDLGGAASALGLISSLQSGNAGGALVSSVSLANALADDIASKAIGSALGMNAVNVIPGLNLALALESGNSVSMVAAAANFIPGYGPLISVGISLLGSAGLFGEAHKPPPPQGETHFAWGEDGSTTVVVDSSVTGGGQIAAGVASNVQHMLEQMVDSINAQTLRDHPDTDPSQLLAINPNLLPAIGYGLNDAGQGSGWLHVVQPDGSISGQPMEPATLAQHLLKILSDNGGLAPQWMVDTQFQRYQHMVQQGASQVDIQRELHAGQGGHAAAGNQAYALQGNAAESADFQEQSFGALVAHVSNPAVQQSVQTLEKTLEQAKEQTAQIQTSQVLRDVEGDGYLERTEWVAASDSAGNTQGALVIDFNGNALIETRDILNLGGNMAEAGNQTDEANGARQNADLQRNNVQWLDANGDGMLNKSDPAFAAIKLWVDINSDGVMQAGEGQTLSSLRMAAIDFTSGQIVYEDGHRDVLTAATLKADTEGVRATQIQEVVLGEDGVARTRAIDAGEVLEHEGYQGQVQVTDEGGTRWGAVREATFEQQAKRTGDWEGTAEQEQHRHGGGNAEGSPTETSATGTTSLEEVKAQATLVAQSTLRPGDGRIAFVPLAQAAAQSEMRVITAAMIQSAQGTLFGTEGLAGLGALTAVALGTVQTAAQAGSQGISASEIDGAILVDAGLAPADGGSNSAYDTLPASTSVKASTLAADSSSGYTVALAQVTPSYVQTSAYHPSAVSDSAAQSAAVPAITATVIIDGLRTAQRTVPSAVASTSSEPSSLVSTRSAGIATAASEGGVVSLDYPVVQGETLAGFEDVVLRLSSALLANDSTINACADPSQPALRVTAVAQSSHGRVSLETRTDAAGHALTEVVFVPELNYHGTAGFDYTVTDQYGLSRTARATLEIAAVNDAPVGVGEIIRSVEDQPLLIQAGALLQNDSDVDNTHADLRIARVQSGAGGTVVLDANGDVVFTPSADYNEVANGPATFTYWVSDPAGGESQPVTASVLMSAVNDAPVALGEVVSGASEDAVFHVDKSILLGNDSDVDDPASALGIAWVGSATGGTVSLDASGNVVFTPTANFNGNATFQYRVRDAAGLESSTVQAVIPVALVNDTPVAVDDQFTTYRNSTMTVAFNQLTGNDTDVDVDALTVSAVRDHAHGTVSIVNGQVQFVPEANFKGQASFDYQAGDGNGGQTWATAYVDVKLPPNLYPTINLSPGATSSVWYGGSAYYNPVEVWQNFSYSLSDESPGSVSMSIVSVIGDLSAAPSASNSFQYHVYDGWGADGVPMQFNILLTDQEGIVNTAHVYVGYDLGALSHPMNGFSVTHDHTGLFVSPVLLDLMGDGLTYQAVSQSVVRYDMNADGVADQIAWVDNKDGVLVWDKDHNGQVSDVSEFSFQALRAGAQTDLEGLQALDTNHNGKLDANDEKFAEFGVWQDANGNGVTDADEFKTLEAWGIAQIDLKSNGQMYNAGTPLTGSTTGETDVTVMGEASFTRIDGSTGMVADAMLAYRPGETAMSVVHVSAASSAATESTASDAYDAEMTRMALLFNQMINTAQASDAEPLGFVPIQVDVHAQEVLLPLQEASLQQLQAA